MRKLQRYHHRERITVTEFVSDLNCDGNCTREMCQFCISFYSKNIQIENACVYDKTEIIYLIYNRICDRKALFWKQSSSLKWRQNGVDGVSNPRRIDGLLNRLFIRRSKKTSKRRVTGLCEGNPPVTNGFPSQRASDTENVSIWHRYHMCHICNIMSLQVVVGSFLYLYAFPCARASK